MYTIVLDHHAIIFHSYFPSSYLQIHDNFYVPVTEKERSAIIYYLCEKSQRFLDFKVDK